MENEVITTQTTKIWVGHDGITRNEIVLGSEITLAEAKLAIQSIIKITKGEKKPVLVDTRQIKSMTHKSRQYLAGQETADALRAVALLINSPISKIIGNFFVNFSKPLVPTKLFTDENEALAWLKGFL